MGLILSVRCTWFGVDVQVNLLQILLSDLTTQGLQQDLRSCVVLYESVILGAGTSPFSMDC